MEMSTSPSASPEERKPKPPITSNPKIDDLIRHNFNKINSALHKKSSSLNSAITMESSSAEQLNPHNLTPGNYANARGNRSSMMSEYSGIIQQVDFDTIKYVSKDIIHPQDNPELYAKSAANKPVINSVDSDAIPKRSDRRFSVDTAKISRITNNQLSSPYQHGKSMVAPQSPLPPLGSNRGSPVRNESDLDSQLDEIMQQASELSSVKTPLNNSSSHFTDINRSGSVISTGNDSFHTAFGSSPSNIQLGDEDRDTDIDMNFQLRDQENVQSRNTERVHSMSTLKALEPPTPIILQKAIDSPPSSSESSPESSPGSANKTSTPKHKRRHKHKHKHRSKKSGSPFSYERLSQLLTTSDGIVIGQEFNHLDLGSNDKFVLERVMDCLSRLTTNMIINPDIAEKQVSKLENVLKVLEEFD